MTAYYNEIDPYAAQWLRNLIEAGLIPAGDVDERSIEDVRPDDLRDYTQCHFFAGIGGWALAARLAGWPDDRELWTGSPPCQPFSVAGKGRAQADERHLWPHLFRLASARRPAVLMGEQVAAAVGKNWLDGVFADLESIGYACGATVVPACAVNAPHRRDRLWFIARDGAVGDGIGAGLEGHAGHGGAAAGRADAYRPASTASGSGAVGDADTPRPLPRSYDGVHSGQEVSRARDVESVRHSSAWDGAGWIIGHDGKARRVEPSIHLLAHGVPARVGRLRAYGNAVVPPLAAEVIRAFMDCMPAPPIRTAATPLKQQGERQ